jgi:hypothetical protein
MNIKKILVIAVPAVILVALIVLFCIRDSLLLSMLKKKEGQNFPVYEDLHLKPINAELQDSLTEFFKNNAKSPENYIIDKFRTHDIVFVGEYHRIKHQVEFIHRLIPLLHQNNIFILGIEFACKKDQEKIDRLIFSKEYDENLAKQIQFHWGVYWPYQEYLDIYRTAWELNRTLPDSARKFSILGLNTYADFSFIKRPADLRNRYKMERVLAQGDGDKVMAETIMENVVQKNEKALIYSGIHHAFTKYYQPVYDERKKKLLSKNESRMGNRVYDEIGDKAMTVFLHAPWVHEKSYTAPGIYPADGIIDAVMNTLENKYKPIGFDIRDNIFERIVIESSMYRRGYDDFTLSDFCDGYIYHMPLSQYEGVTGIENYINSDNFKQAVTQLPKIRFKKGMFKLMLGPESLNWLVIQDAVKMERRFKRYK